MVGFFSSCTIFTVVKNRPDNVPFIFDTKIDVLGDDLTKEEKVRLESGLYEQLDDSIKARKEDKVIFAVLKKPVGLDSSLISKSMQYMQYYLQGEGYFDDSINFTTAVRPNKGQLRTYIDLQVWPGKVTRIDSLSYTLRDDSLQKLTEQHLQQAIIKKNDPFTQGAISSELDRLVSLYKENGYFKFNRNLLYGLWDTLDMSLLQPTFDPFEQAERIRVLRERLLHPTANLDIRLRQVNDTSLIKKYYVGDVYVYPDAKADTTMGNRTEVKSGDVTIIQHYNKFKPKIFEPNIYLKRGDLYNQRRYLRTLNRFNSLGSWRLVDIGWDTTRRMGQDTIDFIARLIPAPKYSFSTNFEGSFNQQSVISNNFFGLGLNIGVQNRNFLRGANTATSNLRYGIELGALDKGDLIQTQQISLSNSVLYPRFVFPGFTKFKNNFSGYINSILSINVANTERRKLYNLTTINTNWGYDFSWRAKNYDANNKTYNLNVKIPNIEYSYLVRRDSLNKLIQRNPSIRNMFSDGLVTSVIGKFTMPWSSKNNHITNVFKTNIEISGLLTGMIPSKFIDSQLYRFVKIDFEYAKMYKWAQSALVLRGFAGLGYEFNFTANPNKRSQLPFFKQYYSGGPNSMRAWQLRRLGPGSTVQYFNGSNSDPSRIIIPDRFGDMQLEANIEYRVPLFAMAGIPVNGALFTDVGNVWLLKKTAGLPDERFNLSRLGTD
ncbi:MAG: BamA/TamA family outer membrane protein, partial [Niabella sp.]